MLVLCRHVGEQIVIGPPGQEIIVTLVELRGSKARIGIEASQEIPVHRKEVWEECYKTKLVTSARESLRRDGEDRHA